MLPAERQRRIAAELSRAGMVTTEELVARLEVSAETVRRDLAQLEGQGVLSRVHGGATAISGLAGEEAPFAQRSSLRRDAKVAIGRAAAALVRPGQTVVIDVGTTALEVARALDHLHRGVFATPSLLVAAELSTRAGVEVLMSGGRVRGGDLACSNHLTVSFFLDLRPDVAFLGSGGLDVTAGLTDFEYDEIATKRTILANSARTYVLADASKHGKVAAHRVCGLGDFTGVVTDSAPDVELTGAIRRAGGEVITA